MNASNSCSKMDDNIKMDDNGGQNPIPDGGDDAFQVDLENDVSMDSAEGKSDEQVRFYLLHLDALFCLLAATNLLLFCFF